MMYQFYVDVEEGTLSIMVTMRSCDVFLGLNFNLGSYSLLLYIVAKICRLTPGDLIMNLGDAHIYLNHIQQCRELLSRTPKAPPRLKIDTIDDIDEVRAEHIHLIGYDPHPAIKAEMAI
jgi:thymidylate synthase